jgi:hypothetical protein
MVCPFFLVGFYSAIQANRERCAVQAAVQYLESQFSDPSTQPSWAVAPWGKASFMSIP